MNWSFWKKVEKIEGGYNEIRNNPPTKLSDIKRLYENIREESMMLNQKFDALSKLLGIEIVADYKSNPPEAIVKSIKDNGLLGNSKKHIQASLTTEKFIALQYKTMRAYIRFVKELEVG